jgi:hypothetical protein
VDQFCNSRKATGAPLSRMANVREKASLQTVAAEISQENWLRVWHYSLKNQLFHETVRQVRRQDYDGRVQVHTSLLNVVLYD